jgi:hypothetical protein
MQPNDGGPLPWNCGREKQAQHKVIAIIGSIACNQPALQNMCQ